MPPRRSLFALFQPAQIQQLREAFQLIDNDNDGWVTEHDLRQTFTSLGIAPSPETLAQLVEARPGATHPADAGINFTMFLTMMSERLSQLDPEADLNDAFVCFDDADTGLVKADELRKWLADVGDRMDQHEIDAFLSGSFTDRHGNFNYRAWINVLRVNDDPDGAEPEYIHP